MLKAFSVAARNSKGDGLNINDNKDINHNNNDDNNNNHHNDDYNNDNSDDDDDCDDDDMIRYNMIWYMI